MNKKFSHLFFAFALIFCMFGSAFSQDDGRSSGNSFSESPRGGSSSSNDSALKPQDIRNRLAPLAHYELAGARGRILINTIKSLPDTPRVKFLISAGLGVPAAQVESDFQNSLMPLGDFVVAEIIADTAGVPIQTVVDMANDHTISEVCMILNLSPSQILALINAFINACNNEISGLGQTDTNTMVNLFTTVLRRTDNRFDLIAARLGTNTFNAIVDARLSFETGLSITVFQQIRSTLPSNFTTTQLVVSVLVAGTINAVIPGSFDLSSNLFLNSNLFTPSVIAELLSMNNIPAGLIAARIEIFQRSCGTIANIR